MSLVKRIILVKVFFSFLFTVSSLFYSFQNFMKTLILSFSSLDTRDYFIHKDNRRSSLGFFSFSFCVFFKEGQFFRYFFFLFFFLSLQMFVYYSKHCFHTMNPFMVAFNKNMKFCSSVCDKKERRYSWKRTNIYFKKKVFFVKNLYICFLTS